MRRLIYVVTVLILLCNSCKSPIPIVLKEEFNKALQSDYKSEQDLQKFHNVTDSLWSHMYWIDNDLDRLRKQTNVKHPYYLADFKRTKLYKKNIKILLYADNPYKRIVAHKLINYTNDDRYADTLLETIENDTNNDVKYYNIVGIAKMCPRETDIVFDYIVNNTKLAPYQYEYTAGRNYTYLAMDTASLIRTAYSNVSDSNINAQVLAIYTLSNLDTTEKPLKYIVNALNTWDDSVKAYAFSALATYKKEELKDYLKPYQQNAKLWMYVVQALKSSTSIDDIKFADSVIQLHK